ADGRETPASLRVPRPTHPSQCRERVCDFGGVRIRCECGRPYPLDKRNNPRYRRLVWCPKCRKRFRYLYRYEGVMACRKCLGLRYKSQTESQRRRWTRKCEAAHALQNELRAHRRPCEEIHAVWEKLDVPYSY